MNKKSILAVLEALSLVGDRALPFGVIAPYVRADSLVPVSDEEILKTIRHCKEQGWIDRKVDALDGTEMWFLVDAGRIAMRSHR